MCPLPAPQKPPLHPSPTVRPASRPDHTHHKSRPSSAGQWLSSGVVPPDPLANIPSKYGFDHYMATILESLKRSVATATLDIEDAEAEKTVLEAWIRTRKQERHRLEAELARELATAAGKPPQSVMQTPSSASSLSDPARRGSHASGPRAAAQMWDTGQAASPAADAPVTASRKRKREAPAPAAEATATANSASASGSGSGSASGGGGHGCSFCPKRFKNRWDVIRHERTHTGERPYGCSLCPKRFTQRSDVTVHERTHTGERPYGCSLCPKRFTQRGSVTVHERTHTPN